jgi:hypothetical protein
VYQLFQQSQLTLPILSYNIEIHENQNNMVS